MGGVRGQREAALPTAPLRPGAAPSKATSLGRGFGRGQAPPRKPLPPMTRPAAPNPAAAPTASATAAAAAAAAVAPVAASRVPAASDTDEEEEPSRDDESVADDDEEDDVEDEDEDNAGGAASVLRMETILRTPLLRVFFDEWMPVTKRSAEVLLFDAIQQLLQESPGAEAMKRASALVALHMDPGARQEVALPVEPVRQIKQELGVPGASLPTTLFGLVQNAVLAALDRTVLPLFRGSDQYLGLLGHVVTMQQSGEDLFDNPFLDRNEIQETTEPGDDEQNPFVGGDIDELADLAQNLHLEDDNMLIGLNGFE